MASVEMVMSKMIMCATGAAPDGAGEDGNFTNKVRRRQHDVAARPLGMYAQNDFQPSVGVVVPERRPGQFGRQPPCHRPRTPIAIWS